MLRSRLSAAMKEAMRDKDKKRLSTIRLMIAAIKDKDIAARSADNSEGVSDGDILGILAKMIKQRLESAKTYEEAGRIDSAEGERGEIKVIEEFLPKQLSDQQVEAAIQDTIKSVGAQSIRDMGKIMGALKTKYTGQMDFAKAGATIKGMLG